MSGYVFYRLDWDTAFFAVPCAKAVLHTVLTCEEQQALCAQLKTAEFISITNEHAKIQNAIFLGERTSAYLADVNIQFEKRLADINSELDPNLAIKNNLCYDARIVALADFAQSKFRTDPNLASRGGAEVHPQWVKNAMGKEDKYFAISGGTEPNGFCLFHMEDGVCTIELIAAGGRHDGTGSKLFEAVERYAKQAGCQTLQVGTQATNLPAMNFYQKCGCRQIACHQVFHLWNRP